MLVGDLGVTCLERLEEVVSQNAARAAFLTAPGVDFAPQRMAKVGQFVVPAIDASLTRVAIPPTRVPTRELFEAAGR